MIVEHPFWDRVKAKKGDIDPMSGLPIEEYILPNEKYWKFLKKLWGLK